MSERRRHIDIHIGRRARFLLFSLLLIVSLAATSASAHRQGYGFAWASNPTSASYTASPTYSYNDGGGDITIERTGTGLYLVTFEDITKIGIVNGGHVQVTAYGSSSDYCKVVLWTVTTVSVACFDNGGNPTDSAFNVLYLIPDEDIDDYAYAWADEETTASYSPPGFWSYNAEGGINVTRNGAGDYTVDFDGFGGVGDTGSHTQVTAYGAGNARCRIVSWGGDIVNVRCASASGAAVDSQFTVLYSRPEIGDDGWAFAWADDIASANYSPSASFSYNPTGGSITATRTSAGVYTMSWADLADVGINGGHVQVSAYSGGGADVYCKVSSWGSANATIRCFNTAGNPTDARYNILFLKPPKKNWTQDFAFAWADSPTAASYEPDTQYSFNRAGQPIRIDRTGTGLYNVVFEAFDYYTFGGNVQVSHYGGGTGYCKVRGWTADTVQVGCFDALGLPSDEFFTVLYLKASSTTTAAAWAWASQLTSASYTPTPNYSRNATGGSITATRLGVGQYSMTWDGIGALGEGGGHMQVTAYGTNSHRCSIVGWNAETVTINCFDATGAFADSAYSVLALRPDAKDDAMAFAWANNSNTASYTPSSTYSFNSGDGPVTATRSGTGVYNMDFEGFQEQGIDGGHVQVSAYGSGDVRCGVSSWGDRSASVRCYDSGGSPADSAYNVLMLKPIALPEPGLAALLLVGASGLVATARRRDARRRAAAG